LWRAKQHATLDGCVGGTFLPFFFKPLYIDVKLSSCKITWYVLLF
jgi:hypothetical protein